ncbi:prepilin peptidase [Croceibacterium sp. TMG7-5b_MA50]|uniref:A24 family peptidase n=1 Tax=Croceibacterium sp. TMG7-5b_MA50 TaxID=3121290 RepID=UPI003221467B
MTDPSPATYGLLALLAIALLLAAVGDWRHRLIRNRLNAAIACSAPLFWLASGLPLWPGVAAQLALAAAVLAVCAGLFAIRVLGGGDVKLLAALALWVRPHAFPDLLLVMALTGGLLAAALLLTHRRSGTGTSVPYGIAIAVAGLWVLPALSA